ncbi:MAG: hypothetical protein MJK14_15090, partial [Rivularia sp. ALOHA_DT_140]|nr:hypothetical protein [Rivularia sp. ALOHA_DT_140]
ATVTGLGIACIVAPGASLAQTSEGVYTPSSLQNDSFDSKQGDNGSFNGTQNGNFDPFSLIHQSQLGGPLNWQEFSSQNRKQINSEADSFLQRQRKLLQQRQGQNQQQQRKLDFVMPVYTPAQTSPASGN